MTPVLNTFFFIENCLLNTFCISMKHVNSPPPDLMCELSQFLLIKFSTLDCGTIHEYPRSHLHLLDSLTHSSFRRKFQITWTYLEPKALVNSRLFLGCSYYTAITSSPSPIPQQQKFSSSAAVAEFKHTTLLVWQSSASLFSNSFVLGSVVIHQERRASSASSISNLIR